MCFSLSSACCICDCAQLAFQSVVAHAQALFCVKIVCIVCPAGCCTGTCTRLPERFCFWISINFAAVFLRIALKVRQARLSHARCLLWHFYKAFFTAALFCDLRLKRQVRVCVFGTDAHALVCSVTVLWCGYTAHATISTTTMIRTGSGKRSSSIVCTAMYINGSESIKEVYHEV